MAKSYNRIINTMKLALLLVLISFTLTGCGEHLQTFVETDLRDMITNRIVANQNAAKQLFNAGLMTELEYETIMSALKEKETELLKANEGDTTAQKPMFSAMASFRKVPWVGTGEKNADNKEINAEGYTEDEWKEYIASNAIDEYFSKIPGSEYMNILRGSGTVVPISIIDEDTGTDINKRFGFPIYVLKTAQDLGGEITEMPLDEISEMINMAISDPNNIDLAILDKYFTPALDASGNKVTLLDTTKRENKIVVTSDGSSSTYVNHPDSTSNPNKVLESQRSRETYAGSVYTNRPGKDMIVRQEGYEIFSVRFTEFNQDAIDKVIRTLGLSDSKYLITADGAGGRVYLLEYPAHYVESFEEEGDNFKTNFAQSNLGVNLKTGDFVKYSGAWDESQDGKSLAGVTTLKDDPYLNLKGATSNTDVAHASFSLYGDSEFKLGEKKVNVKAGRLVLKDYLEATYAPGVVTNENVVVFGRKIRIENFSGTKDKVVARFYNQLGQKIDIGGNLYINDFADMEYLTAGNAEVRFIKGLQEADMNRVGSDENEDADDPDDPDNLADSSDETPSTEELIQSAIKKIDKLPMSNTDKIKPAIGFPSKSIGRIDNHESETPYFYAMAVKKSMFDTGLFSGWIYQTDSGGNSLTWWNDWLREHLYSYKIDKTILEEYLSGNYAYELGQQGILVLDLETIAKIQEEYNEQDKIEQNRFIRTIFMLLGATLIGYSLIMLLAWVLDTNVDLGFNILEKMTFGHYIAVTDESEIPQIDTESRRYIGFSNLVIKSCIMAVIGIVLILVDFMQIGYWLIQVFGGIAKMISRLINNF